MGTHLLAFGINHTRDIVAATGDGASVMLRFGTLNYFIYQSCQSSSRNKQNFLKEK